MITHGETGDTGTFTQCAVGAQMQRIPPDQLGLRMEMACRIIERAGKHCAHRGRSSKLLL
jgi:hypothetical protein